MSNIYLFGTDVRTSLGRVTAVNSLITVDSLKPRFLVLLSRVEYSDNRGQHRIWAKEGSMAADAC